MENNRSSKDHTSIVQGPPHLANSASVVLAVSPFIVRLTNMVTPADRTLLDRWYCTTRRLVVETSQRLLVVKWCSAIVASWRAVLQ